jgi:GNAT superfamily N-acetyltransferase
VDGKKIDTLHLLIGTVMAPISIIPLRWDQYAVCRQVFIDVFDMSEIPYFIQAWSQRNEEHSFAALYKGVLVGFGLVDKSRCIRYISVHEDFQNMGLGSKLLTKILGSVRDERSIWLTTAGDERLLGWYKRYGFVAYDVTYDGDVFIGADMVKRQRCRSEKVNNLFTA